MPAAGFYEWQLQADGTKQPHPVSKRVNTPRNDDPELVALVEPSSSEAIFELT